MVPGSITFRFDAPADQWPFVESYLTPAWERFAASDAFETGWFWPYAGFAGYDGEADLDPATLELVFEGDPDALAAAERDRWDALVEDDRLADYEITDWSDEYDSLLAQQRDAKGEVGGERDYLLKPICTRFALDVAEALDERPPVVGEIGPENPKAVGFWAVIHYAMVQNGYDWVDELDACAKAMRNRARSLAHYFDAETAREELDRRIAELEAFRSELDERSAIDG